MSIILSVPTCPECGERPRGTIEELKGVAEFKDDPDLEYSGHTEIWWDEQRSVRTPDGKVILICSECGHEWPSEMTET